MADKLDEARDAIVNELRTFWAEIFPSAGAWACGQGLVKRVVLARNHLQQVRGEIDLVLSFLHEPTDSELPTVTPRPPEPKPKTQAKKKGRPTNAFKHEVAAAYLAAGDADVRQKVIEYYGVTAVQAKEWLEKIQKPTRGRPKMPERVIKTDERIEE